MTRAAPAILLVLLAAAVVSGVERFPPPEFTDHALPTTQTPPASPDLEEYLDLAMLAAVLAVAAFFALVVRRRSALLVLAAFSLAYFGFWRQGCVCPIGSVQNVARALFDSSYALPWTVVAIFALPLAAALLFGRVFCAAVCPLGAVQDLVHVRTVRVPPALASALRLLAYAYLGAAVLFAATGSAFIICQYDPFVAFFRLSGTLPMLVLGVCLLAIGLFVARPYCRFFCPYGVLLGWLSRLSWKRVTITPEECVRCRLCEDSCPFGAIRPANADQPAPPRSAGKALLAILLILLPVLVAGGAVLGRAAGPGLARMHATVRLADRIRLEESGEAQDLIDASKAFRGTGQPIEGLYADADAIEARFLWGGAVLGGFLGLAVAARLIALSVRRRREDYEADRSDCLACGRCFEYCPIERKRRGEIAAPAKSAS